MRVTLAGSEGLEEAAEEELPRCGSPSSGAVKDVPAAGKADQMATVSSLLPGLGRASVSAGMSSPPRRGATKNERVFALQSGLNHGLGFSLFFWKFLPVFQYSGGRRGPCHARPYLNDVAAWERIAIASWMRRVALWNLPVTGCAYPGLYRLISAILNRVIRIPAAAEATCRRKFIHILCQRLTRCRSMEHLCSGGVFENFW